MHLMKWGQNTCGGQREKESNIITSNYTNDCVAVTVDRHNGLHNNSVTKAGEHINIGGELHG